MGRAIVREPKAFLMDEPLSNLDAKLRVEMRASLAQLHARLGVTTVYVTHDQTEAMTLGQRVAVLDGGRILQVDTPQRLYDHPANVFVAAFIGTPAMNLVEGAIDGDEVVVRRLPGPARRGAAAASPAAPVVVGDPPRGVRRGRASPRAGATTFTVVPVVVEELGSDAHVFFHVDARGGRRGCERPRRGGAPARVASALQRPRRPAGARPGRRAARARARPARLHFFDPESGETLLPDDARGRAPARRWPRRRRDQASARRATGSST